MFISSFEVLVSLGGGVMCVGLLVVGLLLVSRLALGEMIGVLLLLCFCASLCSAFITCSVLIFFENGFCVVRSWRFG